MSRLSVTRWSGGQSFLRCAMLSCLLLAASANAQRPAAKVRVSEAVETSLAPITLVAGTVVSRQDARLSAEQEGRLLELLDVGTEVSAGDLVARIDDAPLRLRVTELEAEVERTKSSLSFLTAEYQRQQELSSRQLTSATALEQTRSEQRVAASELAVAESRLEQARDDLARATIRAPFDGVVVERAMQVGERVSVGMEVVRLKNPNALEIIARPPLNYYSYISSGDSVEVKSNRGSEFWPVRTKVSLGNEDTHVFELRLDVDPGFYASGETVRVGVPIATLQQVVAVPRDALVLRGTGTTIYILQADMTVRQVDVTAGVGDQNLVGVQGDIRAGDQVIIRGNERLQPGQTVELLGA